MATCEICGKEMGEQDSRFCSRKCYGLGQRKTITKTCLQCGKNFPARKDATGKFCSRECLYAYAQVTVACEGCGKLFTKRKSSPRTHCTKSCATRKQFTKPGSTATKICEHCGKEFIYYPGSTPERRYCSRKCQKAAKRTWTTCPRCGREFWYSNSWPRIYCSLDCYMATSKAGTATPVSPRERRHKPAPYYGPHWDAIRLAVRQRDNFCCQHCGAPEQNYALDVHHIIPFEYFEGDHERANEMMNLITLCRSCHRLTEGGKILLRPRLL